MADPVNGPLVGRPDSNANPTSVLRDRHVWYANVDAAGYCSLFIANGSYLSHAVNTVTAGLIASQAFVSAPNHATYVAEFSRIRWLAAHVEVTYVGASQTAAGRVSVSAHNGSSTVGIAPEAFFDDVGVSGPLADGAQAIIRPFAADFHSTGISTYLSVSEGIAVNVCGAPAGTNTVMITVHRVLEGLPLATSLHRASATHTVSDPLQIAAGDNIQGPKATFQAGAGKSMTEHATGIASLAADAYGAYKAAAPLIDLLGDMFV